MAGQASRRGSWIHPSPRWPAIASEAVRAGPAVYRHMRTQDAITRSREHPENNPEADTSMLYEFRSRATGTVTMVGKSGEQVLQIIGKPVEPTGIITVAQIPAAIAALEAAAEREQPPAEIQNETDEDKREALGANHVSLHQRVYPLIELMREAQAADTDVTWGV